MAESIERYFRMLPKAQGVRAGARRWLPSADVYQTREGWVVVVELAGVSPDEVEVTVQGKTLRLAGSRRDGLCGEAVSCQQLEITYSRFERTIQFPCEIESATLKREYDKGLLVLRLHSSEDCD